MWFGYTKDCLKLAYLVSALILALAHLVALNWLCLGLPYWANLQMITCAGVDVDVDEERRKPR